MNRRYALGMLLLVLAGAGLTYYFTRRPEPKRVIEPPNVTLDDPALTYAVEKARAEIVAAPNDSEKWGRLGQLFLANILADPARDCFREAARLNPDEIRWPYLEAVSFQQRDPQAAMPLWERAASLPGDARIRRTARLRWAEELIANDRLAEAEAILHEVGTSNEPRVEFARGQLAVAKNQPREAITHYLRCQDNPSARQKSLSAIARLSTLIGDTEQAKKAAEQAQRLPPDADWPDPIREELLPYTVGRDALYLQAERQFMMGNIPQAVSLLRQVIDQFPDESRAYFKLGMILAEAGDNRGAEEVLRAGLKIAPNMVQGHFFLAVALFNQAERAGVTSTAGQEYLRAAATAAHRAIELKPDHGFAHLYLGLSQQQLGQSDAALKSLRTAVRCNPEATDPHLHLGEALANRGERKEAEAELTIAASLANPQDARPQKALERLRGKK